MCDNKQCSIHNRVDIEKVETDMGNEWIHKISYVGDWAIFTDDNIYPFQEIAMGLAPHKHMTVLVKVGSGTLGDLPDGLNSNCVYAGILTDSIKETKEVHEGFVYDAKFGLTSNELITPADMIDASTPVL